MLLLTLFWSLTFAFCNTIKAKALCADLKDPMENGCCRSDDECPKWCQVKQTILEPSHIVGTWANGTKWNKQCICRFCLGSRKEIIPLPVQERMTRSHNFFRCLHDFPPFESWAFKNELNVKEEMEHCILDHSKTFENQPASGENKAVGAAMPEFNVALWYLEIRNIGKTEHKSMNGEPVGHYTSMIWKSAKDVGCGLCYPKIQNAFSKGKKDAGDFLWTCQYSNPAPNDMMSMDDNLPDMSKPLAKSMDECCEMVYPEFYDNVTKLLPQMHNSPDFMWMDYDRALPEKRFLESDPVWEHLRELQKHHAINHGHIFTANDLRSV